MHLNHIQWILDQAGPPQQTHRLRTAAGLLTGIIPFSRAPALEKKKKIPTGEDRIVGIYHIAEHASFPRISGITSPAWWHALISTMCSTSLRIGQLMAVPYAAMVWDPTEPELRFSAEFCRKSKSDERHPLVQVAFRDLLAIRGDRQLLFPAPHSKTTIYDEFHRLEKLAGFEPQKGIAFHGLRRRILTDLAKLSPTAAQLAAGHQSYRTTIEHYIGVEALAEAVNRLEIFKKLG